MYFVGSEYNCYTVNLQLLNISLLSWISERNSMSQRSSNEGYKGKRKSAITYVTALFFLVERSIELSNLDDIYDMSRQGLIWEGLGQSETVIWLPPTIRNLQKLIFRVQNEPNTIQYKTGFSQTMWIWL